MTAKDPPPLRPLPRAGAARTETARRDRAPLKVRRFRLTVEDGPDRGLERDSDGPRLVIGTHPSADLVLSDRSVSRLHCEISLEGGSAIVRDQGSRNGVEVNGVPVVIAPLRPGATLLVGRSRVRFELAEDHVLIPASAHSRFGLLVGASAGMRAVFAHLERAAASEVTVLLEGETGTGKDAAAEAIHAQSARAEGPFVVIDCGALPASLLGSELFGHERGAFTGATQDRAGAFEAAAGGTVFLDEIGELDPALQPSLLRALEKREVKRLGGTAWRKIDARVIAATHRNLQADVNRGRFRADLYYRLAVLRVTLPPLREREEDLPPLVEALLEQLGASALPEAMRLRDETFLADLARHTWPGNVRELRNYLERVLALGHRPLVPPVAGADGPDAIQSLRAARDTVVAEFERRYLEALLAHHEGNVSAAARTAGVERGHFYRLLWRHGLR